MYLCLLVYKITVHKGNTNIERKGVTTWEEMKGIVQKECETLKDKHYLWLTIIVYSLQTVSFLTY